MKTLIKTILAVVLLFCAHVTAATTLLKVVVRDCDKQADTATVFTNGCTLNTANLPARWTLDFITSHTDKIYFSINGGTPLELEALPYCPAGHNTPLIFSSGEQTVSIVIATQPPQVDSFLCRDCSDSSTGQSDICFWNQSARGHR